MSLKKYNDLMEYIISSSMTRNRIRVFAMSLIVLAASVALVIGIGSDDCNANAGDVFIVPNEDGIDIEYMVKTDESTVQVGTSTVRDVAVDPSVVSVKIPGTVQHNGVTYEVVELGSYSFFGCESLTSVTIPDSVTEIGGTAFSGCKSLESVTIPDSVTEIGSRAFDYCTSLTSVTIPSNVTNIGYGPFDYCTSLAKIDVNQGNTRYVSEDGVLFDKNMAALIQFPAGRGGTYAIPSDTTEIGSYAFAGCTLLESVTIPGSIEKIGMYAFEDCTSLTSVTIPSNVASIPSSAFYGVCNGDSAAAGATVGHVFDNEYDAECNNGCGYIRDVSDQPGGDDDDPGVTPGGDDEDPGVTPGDDNDSPDVESGEDESGGSTLWLAAIIAIIVVIAIAFFIAKNRGMI